MRISKETTTKFRIYEEERVLHQAYFSIEPPFSNYKEVEIPDADIPEELDQDSEEFLEFLQDYI